MDLKKLIDAAHRTHLVAAVIIILMVAAAITYLVVSLVFARRRVQELLAGQRKLEEELKEAEEAVKLAKEAGEQKALQLKIDKLEIAIATRQAEISHLDKERSNSASTIDRITSWKDLEIVHR
jgi:uncharacterized protein HemX